jgi:hypothetical protein
MPAEQVDAMVAARDEPGARAGGAPAGGGPPASGSDRDPVVRLLRELAKRESLSYVRVQKDDDLVVWRRAA